MCQGLGWERPAAHVTGSFSGAHMCGSGLSWRVFLRHSWCLRNRPFSKTPVRRELCQTQSPGLQHSAYPCSGSPPAKHRPQVWVGKLCCCAAGVGGGRQWSRGHQISSCLNHSLFCWVRKKSQVAKGAR